MYNLELSIELPLPPAPPPPLPPRSGNLKIAPFVHHQQIPFVVRSKTLTNNPMPSSIFIYIIILFVYGAGIWSWVFFISASVWGCWNWNFWTKSIRSSAIFEAWLQRPSPCLIYSAPLDVNADGGWARHARRAHNVVFWTILSSYSSILDVLMYGEVDEIGKTIFPTWRHILYQNKVLLLYKNPHGTAVGIIVVHVFIEFP